MSEEPIMKTSCKDCVFATWGVNAQTGCELGRVEKFIARNEIVDESFDNFYTINRFCNTCRNHEWADKYTSNWITQLNKETDVKYGVILIEFTEESTDDVIYNLRTSCTSLIEQDLQPERIIVALSNPNIDKLVVAKFVRELCKTHNIKCIVSHIIDMQACPEEIVDICFSQLDDQYYTILYAGGELPTTFGSTINHLINEELQQIAMIEPFDGFNGTTYLTMAHAVYKGNIGANLDIKLKDLAKSLDKEELICKTQTFLSLLS